MRPAQQVVHTVWPHEMTFHFGWKDMHTGHSSGSRMVVLGFLGCPPSSSRDRLRERKDPSEEAAAAEAAAAAWPLSWESWGWTDTVRDAIAMGVCCVCGCRGCKHKGNGAWEGRKENERMGRAGGENRPACAESRRFLCPKRSPPVRRSEFGILTHSLSTHVSLRPSNIFITFYYSNSASS